MNLLVNSRAKKDIPVQLQDYIQQAEEYYQRSITEYKNLIQKGSNLEQLYLGLGKLYYRHGEFEKVAQTLKQSKEPQAKKFLAMSYYRLGNFTDALEVFSKNDFADDEYQYFYGLTCEKLNLYDQASKVYKKIKSAEFYRRAAERVELIEKEAGITSLDEIGGEIRKIIATSPAPEKYPQAGALVLYCDENIEITPTHTSRAELHYVVKILNERGKENFSETHIDYDSTYEKVELEYARTIKPDGEVLEVGSRHTRDVSKYLNFPLYSNARAFIISFPGVTAGSVIEYKLKVYNNQLINKKDFVLSYPLQSSEPIISANFNLKLPKDRPLQIKILNEKYNQFGSNLKPRVKEESGRLVYSWQFKDIPQIIPESNMPPLVEVNPTILVSTFTNWQEIYHWWWNLAEDKIEVDVAIKEKVRELTRNSSSPEAKARSIYSFCAKEIRYVAVEYGEAGYEPHPASDIFKNKYGDCKDQAILLVTMLKEAGLSAWPVLIATKEYHNLNVDFPSVLFNHCIAACNLNDKVIFLDPTAETCSFADLPSPDQARKVLVCKEAGYKIEETPLFAAGHNLSKQYVKIKINPDETVEAEKSIFTHGLYDQAQRLWLLYTSPELIEDTLKEAIQGVSIGAKLEKYEIKNLNDLNLPVLFTYTFKGPEYFTTAGRLRIMPQLASLDVPLTGKEKRKYPIDFGLLDTEEIISEIELPSSFVIKYLPEGLSVESPWLKIILEYKQIGNKIIFKQKTQIEKITVSTFEYPDFKVFLEALAKKIKQRIVLEKIN
ncbi:MAG: DUF3857 domain-containing protein [Candidatus Omnitrophica bacterium]|nr:DUF3857 domain-containing protein [Candidatus Omnitrophota bacterium]